MASIKKLAIESTGTMEVKDAAGSVVEDENGVWSITFHSPGTKEFQKAFHAFNEKKASTFKSLVGGKDKTEADQDTKDLADFLAAVTVSFNNFDYEGKTGHAAYRAAFADIEIGHVAQDANKFLGDRGNFWKPKVKDSAPQSDTSLG